MAMTYEVTVGDTMRTVKVARDGPDYVVDVDGQTHHIQAKKLGSALHLLVAGKSYDAGLVRTETGWEVDLVGTAHAVDVVDPRRKALRMASGTGDGLMKSSMPGRVVSVLVSEGEEVSQGQPVLVLEAMKMENELKAPIDGTVAAIHVADGETVDAGAKLILVEG